MTVLGAGLVTADIVQLANGDWEPISDHPSYAAGGTVCNILCHLARTGWHCELIGGVGSDTLGELVLRDLRTFQVGLRAMRVIDGTPTRRIGQLVSLDRTKFGVHRFYTRCVTCGREFPAFPVPPPEAVVRGVEDLIRQRTVLVIDRANELTVALAARVRAAGGVVVFEPGYLSRTRSSVEGVLASTNILKYSELLEYNERPFGTSPLASPAGFDMVIETRGHRGVAIRRANREIRLTTTPVEGGVDSSGAGDAFMAGFLQGLAEAGLFDLARLPDREIEHAAERGQALGGLACLYVGAKGLLNENPSFELESLVTKTVQTRRAPQVDIEPRLDSVSCVRIDSPSEGECRVCRFPLATKAGQ
jgi:fructokinase